MINADVAVIGAGVIGASVAHYAATRGMKVVVLERGDGPCGASVACDGFVFLQSKNPGPTLNLAKQSRALFDGLEAELDANLELERRGGLILARDEEELAFLRSRADALCQAGVPVEMTTPAEAAELEPEVTRRVAGASFCALDAQVNPLLLVHAFLASAQRRGAEVLLQSPVAAAGRVGHVFELACAGATVRAEQLVIAAGAWSGEVALLLGIPLAVRPRRGQLVVTEPAPRLLSRPVMTADYLRAKAGVQTGAAGTSIEQTRAGTLLLGSTREFVGFDTSTTPQAVRSIVERGAQVLPRLKQLSIIRTYAGLRPYCELGRPMLGPAAGQPGLFLATGHEGDGIALAPVTGQAMADWLAGTETHRRPRIGHSNGVAGFS